MSKGTDQFKITIQKYLEKRAEDDSLFSETFKKENKSIDGCVNYILQSVQKSGCNGFADEEIFGMAVHYYDEDSIGEKGNVNAKSMNVVVNHSVELTEEDTAAAKEKAMELAIEEAKEEAKKKLSETVELSDEDLADVKQKAIEKVVLEQKEKLIQKKASKKVESNTEVEPDLFS